MSEDKAIKLEPGDYILEYDMEKVARADLMNTVEGLCDRGIRLWLVRSRGGDALRIVPKESAKRTITTPPGRELHMKNNGSKDLVLVVEQGDFLLPSALIPAKKEETPIITIEKLLEAAIADYKKRILNVLWDNHRTTQDTAAGIYKAIKLIEETS